MFIIANIVALLQTCWIFLSHKVLYFDIISTKNLLILFVIKNIYVTLPLDKSGGYCSFLTVIDGCKD